MSGIFKTGMTLTATGHAERVADDPEVAKVANEVRIRLERVRSALAPATGNTEKH